MRSFSRRMCLSLPFSRATNLCGARAGGSGSGGGGAGGAGSRVGSCEEDADAAATSDRTPRMGGPWTQQQQ